MILTRKCLLVDIFLPRSLSKSLAFCEFASVNFEPRWKENMNHVPFLDDLMALDAPDVKPCLKVRVRLTQSDKCQL